MNRFTHFSIQDFRGRTITWTLATTSGNVLLYITLWKKD